MYFFDAAGKVAKSNYQIKFSLSKYLVHTVRQLKSKFLSLNNNLLMVSFPISFRRGKNGSIIHSSSISWVWTLLWSSSRRFPMRKTWTKKLFSRLFCPSLSAEKFSIVKLSCDTRFQHVFTGCSCVFKFEITVRDHKSVASRFSNLCHYRSIKTNNLFNRFLNIVLQPIFVVM